MSKQLSIIVAPHDNSKTWNFRVSYRLMYTFASLIIVGIIASLLFMFNYGRILVAAERSVLVQRENSNLKTQVAQIDSLKLELLNLQALSIQIKGMLGVAMSAEDSILVANWSPDAKSPTIGGQEATETVEEQEQRMILEALPSMWPLKGYVTREYHFTGGDKHPDYHPGIDIAAARGTPVRASAEGVAETSRWDETYGWMIEVDHGFAIHSLYGHNQRNLVKTGDRVTRGQTIAYLGSTGKSTAPHLHFEVLKNGVPVDPREYLLN